MDTVIGENIFSSPLYLTEVKYTPHIFVHFLLYLFMLQRRRNDTLLQVVSVQVV